MMKKSFVTQSVLAVLVAAAALSASGVDAYRQCVKVGYPMLCEGQTYNGNAYMMMIERDYLGFIDADDFMGFQVYNESTRKAKPVYRHFENGLIGEPVGGIASDTANDTTTATAAAAATSVNTTAAFSSSTTTTTTTMITITTLWSASSEAFCEDELGTIEPVLYVRHFCEAKTNEEEFCTKVDVSNANIYTDGDDNNYLNLLYVDLSDKNNWVDFESCMAEFNYYVQPN